MRKSIGRVNLYPLPLPPGASMPSPSAPNPQVMAKLEFLPMINQWQKGKLIGRGTFGSVYVATNRETGALCAMKEVELLPDDPKSAEYIKQLEREIKVLSHLKHPNIVQYYGSEIVGDRFYIYLEYVYPGSINKYVHDHCGAITESVVRNFTRHILSGLAYLHSKKTIHRDIKGANLLTDAFGVVKLADFGMAKHLTEQAADLSLKGSSYWMAPELLQAVIQKDLSSDLALGVDIWSLGCTIIEMLNGKPPWSEYERAAVMFKVMRESPPIPESLSSEGKDFLRCCFQRNPAERPSASKLLEHRFLKNSQQLDFPSFTQAFNGMRLTDRANSPRGRSNYNHDQLQICPSAQTTKGKLASDRYGSNGAFIVDGANGRKIGKLFVSDKKIAKGSNGTIVFEGTYSGRPVAVKRLVQDHHDMASKEIQNLIESDKHQNIVRLYGEENDENFVYLALEQCTCSLADLIQIYSDYPSQNTQFSDEYNKVRLDSMKVIVGDINLWKANRRPSLLLLKLMRDMVSGLAHLHELKMIHRDLKPQNVLIVKEEPLCAKLCDMGISKRLHPDVSSLGGQPTVCGTSGWKAPERLLHGRQTRALDLFSLGCVLFFCITGGGHPFGDNHFERDYNIVKNQVDLSAVEYIPEAVELFSHLLNPDPELRPKALQVLHHPLFWKSKKRLSFVRDTSDKLESEANKTNSNILKALEKIKPLPSDAKWDTKMDPTFIANISQRRRYQFDSVRDLLRVMRNSLNHYMTLPEEIKEILGPVPEGFDDYFATRFPKLLIEVYKVVCQYCKEEKWCETYLERNV